MSSLKSTLKYSLLFVFLFWLIICFSRMSRILYFSGCCNFSGDVSGLPMYWIIVWRDMKYGWKIYSSSKLWLTISDYPNTCEGLFITKFSAWLNLKAENSVVRARSGETRF